ncbi:hypothetical protein GCM10027570_00830 [Streptomonospora sediminis]
MPIGHALVFGTLGVWRFIRYETGWCRQTRTARRNEGRNPYMGKFITSERLLWVALAVAVVAGVVTVVRSGLGIDAAAIGIVCLMIAVGIGARRSEKAKAAAGDDA